ncbi:MAG: hypothetical protein AAFY07_01965 [Pseudomonadota bacterium]
MRNSSRTTLIAAAAVIGLNSCGLDPDDPDLPVIKVTPGDEVEAVFTPSLKESLELGPPLSPFNITVYREHELQIVLGSETIKMTPGGSRQPTYFSRGVVEGFDMDKTRIRSISSNFGLGPVSRRMALDWSKTACESAVRGLGAESVIDPEEVLSRNNNSVGSTGLIDQVRLCIVETKDLRFSLVLYGPPDDADGVTLPDWDKTGYQISVFAGVPIDDLGDARD